MEPALREWLRSAGVRPKILVVDDQIINIRMVGELFKNDCDIYMAMDGEQAVAQSQARLPDLILLDLVMPGISGHEVCRRLKADPKTQHIPIIFITSQRDEFDEALSFELGAVDYVTKPFEQNILQARVRTHLVLKLQADRLQANERFMRTLTDSIPGLIGYWSADLRCMFCNAAYELYFGKTPAQIMGITIQELLGEALFAKNEPMIRAALRGEAQQFERTMTKPDGSPAYVWTQYVPDIHAARVQGFFVLTSDVSDLKQTQRALETSEQFARTTIDTVPEMICVLDKTGTITTVNQAWRDFFDANLCSPLCSNYAIGSRYVQVFEAALGGASADVAANTAAVTDVAVMAQAVATVLCGERDSFSMEYPCHTGTEQRFFFARLKRFPGNSGHVLVAHGNITDRKMIEMELVRMAHTDVLTGLHNRRRFIELSETELSRTARHGGPVSILMLDIDHFKHVNDTHGHHAGDSVIQMLATLCREQLRELDVIGRLGGEEFAVTMPAADHAQAMLVAERLRQTIAAARVALPQGLSLGVTVSIGVTSLAGGVMDLDPLLDQADQALYRAKSQGRNQVCSFLEMG